MSIASKTWYPSCKTIFLTSIPKHPDGGRPPVSAASMHHGLALLVEYVGSGLRFVNLHLVTVDTFALPFLLLVQQLLFALALDIDTTLVREFLLVHSILALDAFHLAIFARARFLFLLGKLVRTVLLLVRDEISLGLLRRILGGSRRLRIPARGRRVRKKRVWAKSVRGHTYHLMANRVTRGFSASTLRRIFSITGFAGGSFWSSSVSYSLLT